MHLVGGVASPAEPPRCRSELRRGHRPDSTARRAVIRLQGPGAAGSSISGAVLDHQTHMKGGVAGGGRITPAALEGNLLHRVPDVGGLLAEVRLRADVPGEGALRPSTVTPNGW